MVKNVNPFLPNPGSWMEQMKLDSNQPCATVNNSPKGNVKKLGTIAGSRHAIRKRGGKRN